ncbi:MAG TPA: dTMP kinase [Acidobacteriota bacterium]
MLQVSATVLGASLAFLAILAVRIFGRSSTLDVQTFDLSEERCLLYDLGMARGKFITFEGIEGSGKTTHLQHLCLYLDELGLRYVLTREPGGTAFGAEIRSILLNPAGAPRHPYGELLLYLADRVQDLQEIIRPALEGGVHVLCDRYHDATRAYQGAARGIPASLIDQLSLQLEILTPDLTIVFELEVSAALERARRRNVNDGQEHQGRFEGEAVDFHERVRQAYRNMASREPQRFWFIDTGGDFKQAQARVRQIVSSFLNA